MQILYSILSGIGLSAACGFRIFIPFLILSISGASGWIELNEAYVWISSMPALIIFSVLSAAEIAGYFNPWIDNMLDTITTALILFAGILISLSVINDLNPFIRWSVAVIAGGGIAMNFQFLTVKARSVSSVFISGYGNLIIAALELTLSALISFLAVFYPGASIIAVIIFSLVLHDILKKAKARLREKF
ncbi:MAG: DUF4126 domain-containing protein [Bacteroidetes bacterium]|nr:DUF4126 domain-containing protein [Bacteroidota bacterium]